MTHVPPSRYSSASMTLAPCPDATRAARMPPDPPPITNKSTSNSASREGAEGLATDVGTSRRSCNNSVSLKSVSNLFCTAGRNACADRIVRTRAGANVRLDGFAQEPRLLPGPSVRSGSSSPGRLEQEPCATFRLVDPAFDQAGRGDIAVLAANVAGLPHALCERQVVFLQ